ncbi:LGFP repeat-containing protein, partial [Arthrobacter sp. TMS1-12-1]
GGGCYQPFTGGNIYYTPTTGAHAVTEPFRDAWKKAGWQMGIGYPLQSATTTGGYRTVRFQKATITWTPTGTRTTYK